MLTHQYRYIHNGRQIELILQHLKLLLKSKKMIKTKLRLKAILKWNKETVYIEPILFSWHVGIQYKVLTGNSSGSLFCRKRSDFIFPLQTKIAMLFVKACYYVYEGVYWQGRRKIIYRIKRYKLRHNDGDLPF